MHQLQVHASTRTLCNGPLELPFAEILLALIYPSINCKVDAKLTKQNSDIFSHDIVCKHAYQLRININLVFMPTYRLVQPILFFRAQPGPQTSIIVSFNYPKGSPEEEWRTWSRADCSEVNCPAIFIVLQILNRRDGSGVLVQTVFEWVSSIEKDLDERKIIGS